MANPHVDADGNPIPFNPGAPKRPVDSRVKEAITAQRKGVRARGRNETEPNETHVVKHTIKAGLPPDAKFKLKGKIPVIEGLHYTKQGNEITWLKPVPITVPVSAHDATTGARLWEWTARDGDTEEE